MNNNSGRDNSGSSLEFRNHNNTQNFNSVELTKQIQRPTNNDQSNIDLCRWQLRTTLSRKYDNEAAVFAAKRVNDCIERMLFITYFINFHCVRVNVDKNIRLTHQLILHGKCCRFSPWSAGIHLSVV